MKTVQKTVYQSFDGHVFDTEAACREHERDNSGAMLIGLTEERILAALTGQDEELGAAIERCAYLISKRRREAGNLRRRPSSKPGLPQTEGTQEPEREAAPA